MRTFFANGINNFHVPMAVEATTVLLHVSVFLFFAGLLIYFKNINHTVFSAVVCWPAISAAVYGYVTLMPIIWHDSPYCTPLSATAWIVCAGVRFSAFKVLLAFRRRFSHETREHFQFLTLQFRGWLIGGLRKAAKESASKRSPQFDVHILESTLDALRDDDSLEKFAEALPGFYQSDVVGDLRQRLPEDVQRRTLHTLVGFTRRTLSSHPVPGPVKIHRLAICLDAAGQVQPSRGIQLMLDNIIHVNWRGVPHSVEIGHFLRSWDKSNNGQFAPYIQGIVASIIASVRGSDDRWVALATDHLGVPEHVVRDYSVHGDSVQLANLIHITRQLSRSSRSQADRVLIDALPSLSEFDIHNTLSGLQHDFCTLWNEIVQAQNSGTLNSLENVLINIRPIYIALHPGDLPVSYPLCNDPNHRR
jgi:hypothetical protein